MFFSDNVSRPHSTKGKEKFSISVYDVRIWYFPNLLEVVIRCDQESKRNNILCNPEKISFVATSFAIICLASKC